MIAKQWIQNEDRVARSMRTERLQWLLENAPQNEIWLFHAGNLNCELFEQMRYSYVYCQDLSVILLGLSFIEHTLASLLYESGRDDLARKNLSLLVQEARNNFLIDSEEEASIEEARKIRNDITHFRTPTENSSIDWQTKYNRKAFFSVINVNAKKIVKVCFLLMNKFSPR